MFNKIDQQCVNAIRTLSISQIEKANSGHPGLPMGASPMAYCLWSKFLKINPKNEDWYDRDRFVLSAGHGSAMLYSLLHLSGYDLSIEDLKNFRQLNSKTPGHPEFRHTKGVEVTTGPLGQGIANAVGMAMAERHLAALYNKDDFNLIDHYTYCLCGDGDLMEGISSESLSLAGHLGLSKLILLYDSNDISLDGPLNKSFSEDIKKRFEAYGFSYFRVEDGNDLEEIYTTIEQAKNDNQKPSVIEIKTIIGYGSKNQNTHKVHGAPLGADDYAQVKLKYEWVNDDFCIPDEVYSHFNETITKRGEEENRKWDELFKNYSEKYPEDSKNFLNGFTREIDPSVFENLRKYDSSQKDIATRSSSGQIIQDIADNLQYFWGGSADLSSSNKTLMDNEQSFTKEDYSGRNIFFGVREFAMAAMANGIEAHGGLITYVSTFFVFSDYMKAAVRLSALSKLPVIYVFTHDSVAVGEDGPTHEPIEQLAGFRAMPGVNVLRPADANEVRQAWQIALKSKEKPTIIVLSRQDLKNLKYTENVNMVEKGAYVIASERENADGIIIATGSEVSLALDVKELLYEKGVDVKVVSMPSQELFRQQDQAYIQSVLNPEIKNRMSLEMGSSFGWHEFVGDLGLIVSVDRFGVSAKGEEAIKYLGFDKEKIAQLFVDKFMK